MNFAGSYDLTVQFADFVHLIDPSWRGAVLPAGKIFRVVLSTTTALAVIRALYDGCSVALPRKKIIADEIIRNGKTWKSWGSKRGLQLVTVTSPVRTVALPTITGSGSRL